MNKKTLSFLGLNIIIALLTIVFVSQGWLMGYQNSLQNKFYDFDSPSSEVIIIDIDEKSLSADELGPLSRWPRAHYADVINIVNQEGAKAIGIDVTFPDESIEGKGDDFRLASLAKEDSNVILAAFYYFDQKNRTPEWPNKTLLSTNPTIGWINVKQDIDGFVRQVPLFTRGKEGVTEAFSLAVARKYLEAPAANHVVKKQQYTFSESISIPVITEQDSETNEKVHSMYVNYFAAPATYQHISISEVLKKNFISKRDQPVDFKNKIVLIGPTARDLQDYYLSPVGNGVQSPGVEIHANNIQTIIEQRFLKPQSKNQLWITLLIIFLINGFLFSRLKVRWALPIAILEGVGFMIGGLLIYEKGILLNVIYPLLLIGLTFVGHFLVRFILEQAQRKFVEGAFGHYVNKDLVEQIIKNPKLLELGGTKKEVTAFFSDIAGFTTISEQMSPEQLTQFLNEYLEEMTNIILENQGTLDKYEGDAIVAFWNAPLPLVNHAEAACLSALNQQKKLAELRQRWQQQNLPAIEVRMGINTGEVVTGNMGSKNRFDYTMMGDNANLASRLEGINKQYGTHILISSSTYAQIADKMICREVDFIRVKGRKAAVQIYELICLKSELTQEIANQINAFHAALSLYRKKDFTAAKTAFAAIANDPTSQVFGKRCDFFIQNPPAADWDGAYNFEVK